MRFVIDIPPSKNDSHTEYAVAKKADLIAAVERLVAEEKGAWTAVKRAMSVVRKRSDEYERYLARLDAMLAGQGVTIIEGDVLVGVTVFFPDRRRDMANIVDTLLDALEGRAYVNDRQVVGFLPWSREIDKDDPRCVVTVEPLIMDLFGAEAESPEDLNLNVEF